MRIHIGIVRAAGVAAAFSGLVGTAAAAPIVVKAIAYKGSLPYVVSDDAKRDARINHRIFSTTAEQPAPAQYVARIQVPKEDGLFGRSDFGFSVLRNDGRLLALQVDAEGCGAYCEPFSALYNFDATNGRAVFASDIFTSAGGEVLLKQNLAKRLTQYASAITALNNEAVAHRKKQGIATPWPQPRPDGEQDEQEARIAETIDMYEYCMESMRSPDYSRYHRLTDVALKIDSKSLTFVYERCSNHAMRALDDVGDQLIEYKISELAPYFTAYGKYLLQNGPQVAPPAEPYGQILQGHVGLAAVTLLLSQPYSDGSMSASYFYNKYRRFIALSGKVSGNVVELTESDSADTPRPLIRATIQGGQLEGQWIGKQILDFQAAP